MKIGMSVKYAFEQYGTRGFWLELSPGDIGLEDPTDQSEFTDVLDKLQMQAAKAVEIFLLKDGRVDSDEVITRLQAYK